ncbi:hypothetical protein K1719_016393 [Acacia pycnantha]|nr:hypothetical protein K1719_016393 [Acacia pycnantha]
MSFAEMLKCLVLSLLKVSCSLVDSLVNHGTPSTSRICSHSKDQQKFKLEAPLLQYLSILIQNMDSEHSIYYCFSNGYINNIISYPYIFGGGDLAPYYVSFLRAVSSKLLYFYYLFCHKVKILIVR